MLIKYQTHTIPPSKPEDLCRAEDVRKVERRLASETKKSLKGVEKLK